MAVRRHAKVPRRRATKLRPAPGPCSRRVGQRAAAWPSPWTSSVALVAASDFARAMIKFMASPEVAPLLRKLTVSLPAAPPNRAQKAHGAHGAADRLRGGQRTALIRPALSF